MPRCHLRVPLVMGALLVLAAACPARAQIDVVLRLKHARVLQYEPVRATVLVYNNSGHPLSVTGNGEGANLQFDIEQRPGQRMRLLEPLSIDPPLTVPPTETGDIKVQLQSAYGLYDTGPYTLRAEIDWAGRTFYSPRAFLDVVPGLVLQRLSLPAGAAESGSREFTLRSLHRGRGDYLFLRVDDEADELSLGVYELGRLLRFNEPVMRTDGSGRVHILHQSGPGTYTHSVFDANGQPLGRQFHDAASAAFLEASGGGDLNVRVVQPPHLERLGPSSLRNARNALAPHH